ncbi:nSTAND1 domain-containing NTPase [Nannocystis punicea]|uniref:Novel STAND NTPase 1 domain-containing protein n=1 Tax=Nannocystis punicea TaxID=2995304 RepID=A0ABY7H9R0_9BACT|nr:hypothetical protein [Nannocystis poenicansa]WAS96013.1 hypothetical protein O0S08_07590 [Nannocystis poenicansa]
MSAPKSGPQSPFPGPRPYEAGERDRFHGRAGERRDLAALVVANRLTVLYGPTGAGKTSLLAAGLVPELERAGFMVMPIARPGGLLPPGTNPIHLRNIYSANVLMHWHHGDLDGVVKHTITSYLEAMQDPRPERPLAIVIDQFEDLFTTHTTQWEQREAFLRELVECLAKPERGVEERPVRICLAIREEELAELERYAALLPDLLRVRFRLDPLRRPAALEVLTRAAGGVFSQQDAEKIATDLAHRRVRTFGKLALVPSEFVEPMQLQLACDEKWRRGGRSGPMAKPRDPDEALVRYVDTAIARARTGWGAEARIRRFIGDKLLTPEGARSAVVRGKRSTGGLSNKLVDRLEQERLLRAEERLGARWYELAHDRLLEPMRLSNAAWFESQRRRRRARRVALILLLLAGLGVAGYFAAQWALATYHGLEGEKTGVEAELAAASHTREDLEQSLARAEGALTVERLRAQARALDVDLVGLADDVQAMRGVVADMARFSPRGRDSEPADLTNFVAVAAELPGLGARLTGLVQRHAELTAELAAAAAAKPVVEADLKALSKETASRGPELERLRADLDAVGAEQTRQRVRVLAEVAGFEAPQRGGNGDARAREMARQLWRDAFVLLQRGSTEDARGRFERAHLRDATNAPAWDMIGRIAQTTGDLKLAEQSYRKALSQASDYGPSLGSMASLYLTKEWFLDAERCAREALAAQPDLLSARIVLRAVQQRRQVETESDEEGLSPKNPCVRAAAAPATASNPPASPTPANPEPAKPAE